MKKEYIKKSGEKSTYDYTEYNRQYSQKRNKTIYRLQQLKSYYKKTGNLEKMQSCQIQIDIEKRKESGSND